MEHDILGLVARGPRQVLHSDSEVIHLDGRQHEFFHVDILGARKCPTEHKNNEASNQVENNDEDGQVLARVFSPSELDGSRTARREQERLNFLGACSFVDLFSPARIGVLHEVDRIIIGPFVVKEFINVIILGCNIGDTCVLHVDRGSILNIRLRGICSAAEYDREFTALSAGTLARPRRIHGSHAAVERVGHALALWEIICAVCNVILKDRLGGEFKQILIGTWVGIVEVATGGHLTVFPVELKAALVAFEQVRAAYQLGAWDTDGNQVQKRTAGSAVQRHFRRIIIVGPRER
jgi:hypothetical protein